MSSNSFAGTTELRLKPSLRALQLLLLVHLVPLGLLPLAMEPGWPMALTAAAFALSWWWLRRRPEFGFGPRAIDRIVWNPDGSWVLHVREHHAEALLLGSSYLHPRLIVLNFRLKDGRRRSRALLGDEAEPEVLRRLRARLAATPLP
ncbi:MAG TPA: protein YgfX [Solimonas sp.]|nr:protein YgfX [Solimonas sp.]